MHALLWWEIWFLTVFRYWPYKSDVFFMYKRYFSGFLHIFFLPCATVYCKVPEFREVNSQILGFCICERIVFSEISNGNPTCLIKSWTKMKIVTYWDFDTIRLIYKLVFTSTYYRQKML